MVKLNPNDDRDMAAEIQSKLFRASQATESTKNKEKLCQNLPDIHHVESKPVRIQQKPYTAN